jgi:hypothetical protein
MSTRKLDDVERLERGAELARLHARYESVESEKKETASTLGQALKGLRKRMAKMELRTGVVVEDDQAELFAHEGGQADDDEDDEATEAG